MLACALVPATALAVASRPGSGYLSPRLAELAKPSVYSAPPAEQARALSVAGDGPGSLLRAGNRVLVEVRFDHGAAAGVEDLQAAGAKVINVSSRYQTVTVAAKPGELRQLSGIPGAATATEVLTPIAAAVSICPSGIAVSEGDAQLRAAKARVAFGVDGTGVTVGLLSDSFDRDGHADTDEIEDVESGDLPGPGNTCPAQTTPVEVLDDADSEGEDEGRAMAQIVHDLAPGARLAFATAFTGETAFAENIGRLAKPVGEGGAGAEVIADDITYFNEPFFQEGRIAVAVSEAVADGVSYFSSAANNNLINAGEDIASWETPELRDSSPTACPAGLPSYAEHCMDFDPGAGVDPNFGITVASRATLTLDLQWAQPVDGVTTDLDAYLLSGSTVLAPAAGKEVHNVSAQEPVEILSWKNNSSSARTVQLAIDRCDLACDPVEGGDSGTPRVKFALLENGGGVVSTEYQSSAGGDVVGPTIFGHNGAEDAISVGAIRYNATEAPESFSSRGPVTHYFKPVEGVTPAEPLVTPNEIPKPDIVATDGGADTFFGSCVSHTWRFFGTSAAAPHAAAVAALERQAEPSATVEELKQAMVETAGPVGVFPRPGPAVGAGLLNAGAAIAKLKLEPFSEPTVEIAGPPPQNCELPGTESPSFEAAEKEIEAANPPAEAPAPEEPPRLRRPRTRFLQHPPRLIHTRHSKATAVFRFGSDVSGVTTFVCRVDGDPFHPCPPRFVGRFGVGPHVMRVIATDAAGNADRTPAVFRFRVKQRP